MINQIRSMFLKKMISTKRSWVQQLVQALIPIYFMVVTVVIVRSFPGLSNLPPLPISVYNYSSTTTLLELRTSNDDIFRGYQTLFQGYPSSHHLQTINKDMIDHILSLSDANIGLVNRKYMTAATLGDSNHTVWFNPQGYHTAPLGIDFLYNALLKTVCPSCEIRTVNKPLPYRPNTRVSILGIFDVY